MFSEISFPKNQPLPPISTDHEIEVIKNVDLGLLKQQNILKNEMYNENLGNLNIESQRVIMVFNELLKKTLFIGNIPKYINETSTLNVSKELESLISVLCFI